jgi:three-Cys-motif partner protein
MAEKGGALLPDAYRGREQAYIKHTLLKTYLLKLFLIVGMSARQLDIKELAYVDGFAGPWGDESEDLQSTSIAISLRVLSDCRKALLEHGVNLRFRALYVEKTHPAFARLKEFLARRPADGIDAEALQGDFTQLTPAIQEWARDAFTFFFIDPKAWLPVSVGVLKPLLQRPQSEFLINFMYDFANRALSMGDFQAQVRELLGETPDVKDLLPQEREKTVLAVYRRNLVRLVPTHHPWRARSAYVRVLDPLKNRPKYHLVYLTTHPRGLIEFMEASDALDLVQKRVRAATKQRRRQEKTGMAELFNDVEFVSDEEGHASETEVQAYWVKRLASGPRRIDYAEFADMLEETDWFPSDFQRALGDLIKDGRVRNLDAAGKRRTRFVHFDKGERLELLGESR